MLFGVHVWTCRAGPICIILHTSLNLLWSVWKAWVPAELYPFHLLKMFKVHISIIHVHIIFFRLSELSFGHVSSSTQVGFAQSGKCDDEGKKKTVEKYSFLEAIPLLLVHGEWILTWLAHISSWNPFHEDNLHHVMVLAATPRTNGRSEGLRG